MFATQKFEISGEMKMSEEVKTTETKTAAPAAAASTDRPARPAAGSTDRPARPARPAASGDRRPARRPAGGGRFQRRRKFCKFCADKSMNIDHKDPVLLGQFITERYKILPSRVTGTCAKHQRSLTTAIKRARVLALLSFTPLHHD